MTDETQRRRTASPVETQEAAGLLGDLDGEQGLPEEGSRHAVHHGAGGGGDPDGRLAPGPGQVGDPGRDVRVGVRALAVDEGSALARG